MHGHLDLMRWLLATTGLLTACEGGGCASSRDVVDTYLCEATDLLELGAGEASFEPVGEGDTLRLIPGFQGAQHVFVSARGELDVSSYVVQRAQIELELLDPTSGEALVPPLSFGMPYQVDGPVISVVGALLVVEDPAAVVDREVVLGVKLTPVGASEPAKGAVQGWVRWAE